MGTPDGGGKEDSVDVEDVMLLPEDSQRQTPLELV